MNSLESQSDEKFLENTRMSPNSFKSIFDIVDYFVGPDPSFSTVPYGRKYTVHAALNNLG